MPIYKVRKRNGAIVSFDRSKIAEAIKKAITAVGGEDFSHVDAMSTRATEILEEILDGRTIPSIEDIQDAVEQTLVKE